MSEQTEVKTVATVKWVVPEDKIIKFENDENAKYLNDAVVANLEKYPLQQGDKVEATIDETDPLKPTITFLKKSTDTQTQTESKTEEAPSSNTDTKEFTISGISVKNNGVIFKEEENVWYTMEESVTGSLESKGIAKGDIVKISIQSTAQGKNDIITNIDKLQNEQTSKETKNDYSSKSKNEMQNSIEAQASVNSANRVVAGLVSTGTVDKVKALELITDIANHNFALIQTLKSK